MTDTFGNELNVNDEVITFDISINGTVLKTGKVVKIEKHTDGYHWAEIMFELTIGTEKFHSYVWRKCDGIMIL